MWVLGNFLLRHRKGLKFDALIWLLKSFAIQSGKFVPEKTNIWRDCVDGFIDWVREHIEEVKTRCGVWNGTVVWWILIKSFNPREHH